MREDWIECTLGEVCEKALKVKRSEMPLSDKIKYLDIGSIDNILNQIISHKEYSWEDAPSRAQQIIKKGDVLFSTVRTYLKNIAKVTNEEYQDEICSSGFTVLRAKKNVIDSDYLFFRSISTEFLNSLAKLQTGTSYPAVRDKDVFAQIIPLPSFVEQKAIVKKIDELFSSLVSGIADLKKAQEQLVIYRQAVLKKAFEGELTKEWREKQTNLPTADELLQQIKEERLKYYEQQVADWKKAIRAWEVNGGEGKKPSKPQKNKEVDKLTSTELEGLSSLPSNWKWIKNNELMYYVTSGSRDWKKFYSETKGTHFVRTQDIKTNKLELEGAAFVDLPENVEGKRSLIEKGDLLMTITGANVGKVAHVDFDIPESYVSQSVALMKYVLKSFGPYLHYYFQSTATGAKYVGSMVYGIGRPVLSLDNMRDAPVSVCSFQEQRQIVQEIESRLSVCDKVEQSIKESLLKAHALRQSILKKAFEGSLLSEKEITKCKEDKNYEPASLLLERIIQDRKTKS